MRTWSTEQLAILDKEYPTANLSNLATRLGKTLAAVTSKAKMRRIKRSADIRIWTPQRIETLLELYPERTNHEIAKTIGVTESAVRGMAFKLKLRKSEEFKWEHASKSFFPKGHTPMNKGCKQKDYLSANQIEKIKATQFKKGHTPANHKPVGYERINKDGYIEVKTAEPNVFKQKHRIVWEKHYGEIPRGYNIQFRDGDKRNVNIDNLYMISRAQQLKTQNSMYARYPEDVQYLIRLKGALNRQINKIERKERQ